MKNIFFNSWDKLILLLIILGVILYLYSILGPNSGRILKSNSNQINVQSPTPTIVNSNQPTEIPTVNPTPIPTIIKSIQRINGGEGFDN